MRCRIMRMRHPSLALEDIITSHTMDSASFPEEIRMSSENDFSEGGRHEGHEEGKEDTEAYAQTVQADLDFEAQNDSRVIQQGSYWLGGEQRPGILEMDGNMVDVELFSKLYSGDEVKLKTQSLVTFTDNDHGDAVHVFYFVAAPAENGKACEDPMSHLAVIFNLVSEKVELVNLRNIKPAENQNLDFNTSLCQEAILSFLITSTPIPPVTCDQERNSNPAEGTSTPPKSPENFAVLKENSGPSKPKRRGEKHKNLGITTPGPSKRPRNKPRLMYSPVKSPVNKLKRFQSTKRGGKRNLQMNSSPSSNVAKRSTTQSLPLETKGRSNRTLKKQVAPNSAAVRDACTSMPKNSSNSSNVKIPAEQPPSNIPIGAQLGYMTASGFQPVSGYPSLPQPFDQGALQSQMVPAGSLMHNFLFPGQPFTYTANSTQNDCDAMKLLKGLLLFQYLSK